jgi:hypothetical protein
MKIFGARFGLVAAGLVGATGLLFNINCGSSSNGTGTAGTSGHAGTTGTAGTLGHAGTTGTGGTSTTGGTSGGAAGGAAGGASGGAAGGASGGAAGNAGHAGGASGAAGGASGAAGSNTDGGTAFADFSYTFDTSAQGFALNTFNGSGGNLADLEGGAAATLAWDSAVGNPHPGSLKVNATFTDYGQFVNTSLNVTPSINAAGKSVHAFVMVDAIDGGPNFTGFAQVEVNAVGNSNASTPGAGLTPGVWKEIILTIPAASASFDPTQIIQFSVLFGSGTRPEGGSFGGPVHATFHIDSITDGSGNPPPPQADYTFDTSSEGFALNTSIVTPDGGAAPALTWDSAVGNPSPGSLKTVVTFRGYNENFLVGLSPQPILNLTGKTLHAKVMLDTGSALPAGTTSNYVQLYAISGIGFVFAGSPTGSSFTSTSAGTWIDLTFNFGTGFTPANGFDVTQVNQIGVQIGINSGPEGGAFPTPAPTSFHIDTIIAQ